MRAAVFQGVGRPLSVEDVPDPELLPRFALVRVGACGICGTDLSITSGRGFLQMPAGWILGHEYAGEVVAVGRDVERLRVGDHVTALAIPACGHCPRCLEGDPQWCTGEEKLMGSGAYAEYAAIAEVQAVEVPGGLSWSDGAIIEPAAVGLHGVKLAGLAPDDRVLVIGAGPIGLAAVFWARRMGAGRVAVMASTARRGPFADAAGATSFLVGGDDPVAEAIDALGRRAGRRDRGSRGPGNHRAGDADGEAVGHRRRARLVHRPRQLCARVVPDEGDPVAVLDDV